MQSIAQGFIFRRINTPVHNLDPRVKLLVSSFLLTLSAISNQFFEAVLILTIITLVSASAKILRRFSRTMMYSAPFAFFIILLNAVTLWDIQTSILLGLRFLAIISSTSIFFLTTSPDELQYIMRWFRLPKDFVFAFVTAVRFVPVLMIDTVQIMDAQKSRGLEIEKGNFIKRIRNLVPVLVPLLVTAVLRSTELAEAMEARAYGAVDKPTSMYTLRMKGKDWIVTMIAATLFTVALLYFYGILYLGIEFPIRI